MSEICKKSNDQDRYDHFNWERKHGVEFLSRVLGELGHPSEPDETLFEILQEVHTKTNVCIISLEDARAINGQYDELAFIDDKHRNIAIDARIEAREERLRQEKKERDDFPF